MGCADILSELMKKLDVTMYGLGKRLGLKSDSHVWLLIKGDVKPSFETCYKIIDLANDNGMNVSIEMLRPRK